jgi:hypothetical protein
VGFIVSPHGKLRRAGWHEAHDLYVEPLPYGIGGLTVKLYANGRFRIKTAVAWV